MGRLESQTRALVALVMVVVVNSLNSISPSLTPEHFYRETMTLTELIELKKQEILDIKVKLLTAQSELEKLLAEMDSEAEDVTRSLPALSPVTKLSNDSIRRYSRQMILPDLRPEGQRRLLASSVLIVGCGGEKILQIFSPQVLVEIFSCL